MLRSRLVSFTEPLRKRYQKNVYSRSGLSGENLRYLLFSSQLGILFGGREGGGLGSSGKSRIHSCLTAELERIHSHLMYLGAMAHKMGFDTLFMFTWSGEKL